MLPGILLVALVIKALAPATPDASMVTGCYGRSDLPLVRIEPPNLWVGSSLVSSAVTIEQGKPGFQVHADKGFELLRHGQGYKVLPANPHGMIIGVYLDQRRRPLLALSVLGNQEPGTPFAVPRGFATIPKVDCPN